MANPSGATAKYGFPFLLETDVPDIATASQDLAQGVENVVSSASAVARTYAVPGLIAVQSGLANYLPPFFEPVAAGSKTLVAVRYIIRAGTSVTFSVQQNGTAVAGLGSLSATTTAATTNATTPPAVANGDGFAIVVSAVSGTPDGLSVSLFFDFIQ